MMDKNQRIEKCGPVATFCMFVCGLFLGLVGVLSSHLAISFYRYHFVLLFPVWMGILLGMGVSMGARIGRCTRQLSGFLMVTLLSIFCYALLLILNNFTSLTEPGTAVKEYYYLRRDFVEPLQKTVSQYGLDLKTWDTLKEVWFQWASLLPAYDEKAMVSNHEFSVFLEYPPLTRWQAQRKILEFEKVQNWMVWGVELLVLILVAWEKTHKTIQYNYARAYSRKMLQSEVKSSPTETKTLENRLANLNLEPGRVSEASQQAKKPEAPVKTPGTETPTVTIPPMPVDHTEIPATMILDRQVDTTKTLTLPQPDMPGTGPTTSTSATLNRPTDTPKTQESPEIKAQQPPPGPGYALLLRGYDPARTEALVDFMTKSLNMSMDKAKVLLKTPSLLKAPVTDLEAQTLVKAFNQLGARVQVITLEQLRAIAEKQRRQKSKEPSRTLSESVTQGLEVPTLMTPPFSRDNPRYGVLLQKFDKTYEEEVLHLLASLTGLTIERLKSALRTPALVVKNVTQEEADRIGQQFKGIGAEVTILTMQEVEKLFAPKRSA
ncbi:MAG TPA: hypothetical protein VNM22_12910 [Candidatus Limnocylindrales bacterium]|nr:hypothetical protein [Candidatus Limnocylindrales bacterium]